nr:MAG TPA: hypothetical protein [Caudoviricetes sp.]
MKSYLIKRKQVITLNFLAEIKCFVFVFVF